MTSTNEAAELSARAARVLQGNVPFDTERFMSASDAAAELFEQALVLQSQHVPALIGLGRCRGFSPSRAEDAAELFERAISLAPDSADAHFELGRIRLFQAEGADSSKRRALFDASIDALLKARDRSHPEDSWVTNFIGRAYFRKCAYREAESWFTVSAEACLSEKAWIPSTFFLAARAMVALGEPGKAADWYERGVSEGLIAGVDEDLPHRIRSLRRISRCPRWVRPPLMRLYRYVWD